LSTDLGSATETIEAAPASGSDAAQYAHEFGVSLEEAERRLSIQSQLGPVVEELTARAEVPVSAEILESPGDVGAVYGGAKLSGCTSGFSARNSSGVYGFITAGHCTNTQSYYTSASTSIPTTYYGEIYDSDQDLQFHSTSHAEYAKYYAPAYTALYSVRGTVPRSSQQVGYWVCHQGKTTGYSCGNIIATDHAPTWAGECNNRGCANTWSRVSGSTLKCWKGDSGGPWFNNGYAYGIHHGHYASGPTAAETSSCVYMAINYVAGAGLTVLTE
jgi:hypothetical protein